MDTVGVAIIVLTEQQHRLLAAFETHDVDVIESVLDAGIDIHAPIRDRTPVNWLLDMYTRSDRFPDCLRTLLRHGARLDDRCLEPVLLNDADTLAAALRDDPSLLNHRTTMRSAFTPLEGASLLHVAAEYGHLVSASVLIEFGADVNARAAINEHGMNGHTPIFHTVNSHANRSDPVMRLLLDRGSHLDITLDGITWGAGFEWETTLFDVTLISYAQAGLLPQMHRDEQHVYDTVRTLLEANDRVVPPLSNVPNQYVAKS